MSDRFSVSSNALKFIDELDKTNFLGLGIAETERLDLFMFAVAIGLGVKRRKPLEHKKGFALYDRLATRITYKPLLSALYLAEHLEGDELDDKIVEQEIFSTAEEYANEGFEILRQLYEKGGNEEKHIWEMIGDMDKLYNNFFSDDEVGPLKEKYTYLET